MGIAQNDLRLLFREFDTVEAAREALRDVLPALVVVYGSAAATLGADWYDDLRDASEARGRFRAIPADLPDQGRTDALAGWATSVAADGPEWDKGATLTLVEGGLQRIVANADRGSIMRSSVADPASAGWKRIGFGACAFCRMLIGRDELYSQETADFASHDHCNCQAYPLLPGYEPIDVKQYAKRAEPLPQADKDRARKWIAEHLD